MKKILVVLGEKFIDPQEEGFFLDVNRVLGLDHNSGEGEASFLEVDARLVGDAIYSSRVVTEAPVGSTGASICDQIIENFLFQLGPNGVCKQKNVLHLGFGVPGLIPGSASDATAKATKRFLVWARSVGCSHGCAAIWNWGSGRRREKLLAIVLDISIEDFVVRYCQKRREVSLRGRLSCERNESRAKCSRCHKGAIHRGELHRAAFCWG